MQDPVIAYESAQYIQDTTIHMESGAGLLMTDIFTPGWSESRGAFTYDWIRSKMNVFQYEKNSNWYSNSLFILFSFCLFF
ncbi:UNVERIFIED_CONTAM: urease accessory protein UreD, partial [Bacillus sp. ATCC 13368]